MLRFTLVAPTTARRAAELIRRAQAGEAVEIDGNDLFAEVTEQLERAGIAAEFVRHDPGRDVVLTMEDAEIAVRDGIMMLPLETEQPATSATTERQRCLDIIGSYVRSLDDDTTNQPNLTDGDLASIRLRRKALEFVAEQIRRGKT